MSSIITAFFLLFQLYLSQYGYLGPTKGNSSQLLDESSYRKAIEDFQAFAGLDVTGKFSFIPKSFLWILDSIGVENNTNRMLFIYFRQCLSLTIFEISTIHVKLLVYQRPT